MIRVTALYPLVEDKPFNLEYYLETHIPLVRGLLGKLCSKIAVVKGLTGPTPDSSPDFTIMGELYFNSLEDLSTAMASHSQAIFDDIPNFAPGGINVQVGEVIVS